MPTRRLSLVLGAEPCTIFSWWNENWPGASTSLVAWLSSTSTAISWLSDSRLAVPSL